MYKLSQRGVESSFPSVCLPGYFTYTLVDSFPFKDKYWSYESRTRNGNFFFLSNEFSLKFSFLSYFFYEEWMFIDIY